MERLAPSEGVVRPGELAREDGSEFVGRCAEVGEGTRSLA